MADLKTFPPLISVRIKTAIKHEQGSSTGDYRSNAPGAIKPATPVKTALTVISELCRLVEMDGSGDQIDQAVKAGINIAQEWKAKYGYK